MVVNGLLPSCLNCELWQEKQEVCEKYGRPPAHIIVYGCPEWDQMIPF